MNYLFKSLIIVLSLSINVAQSMQCAKCQHVQLSAEAQLTKDLNDVLYTKREAWIAVTFTDEHFCPYRKRMEKTYDIERLKRYADYLCYYAILENRPILLQTFLPFIPEPLKLFGFTSDKISCTVILAPTASLLHYAANKSPAMVAILLGRVTDKNDLNLKERTDRGNTALHNATLAGNADTVALLLRAGANPCIPNNNGIQPLDLTANEDIRGMLLAAMVVKINEESSTQKEPSENL